MKRKLQRMGALLLMLPCLIAKLAHASEVPGLTNEENIEILGMEGQEDGIMQFGLNTKSEEADELKRSGAVNENFYDIENTGYAVWRGASKGDLAETVHWTFNSDKDLLDISGYGYMKDFNQNGIDESENYSSINYRTYADNSIYGSDVTDGEYTLSFSSKEILNIGDYAFCSKYIKLSDWKYNPPVLTGLVTLPEAMISIGNHAFEGSRINAISFNKNLEKIGDSAFAECNNITELDFNESLNTIGSKAFYYNKSLVGKLRIPSSVTAIGESAFEGCDAITDPISFGSGIYLKEIPKKTFKNCGISGLVELPEGLQKIGEEAFSNTRLKTVYIPSSVTYIAEDAFKGSSYIKKVVFGGSESQFKAALAAGGGNGGFAAGTVAYAYNRKIEKYGVAFDSNGGSDVPSQEVTEDEYISVPEAPTRNGYSFDGWYTEREGGAKWNFTSMQVTENTTLYAHWTLSRDYVIVTFDPQNGKDAFERNVTMRKTLGQDMPSDPKKDGFVFKGWYTQKNGEGNRLDSDTVCEADITVYAFWEEEVYCDVHFIDKLSGSDVSYSILSNTSFGSNFPPDPARDGYRFKGWFTEENGKGTRCENSSTILGDVDLYAYWEEIEYCTVKFVDKLKETNLEIKVEKSSSLGGQFPAIPKESSYAFQGWFMKENGQGNQLKSDTAVDNNMTVYAYWVKTEFTIRFVDNLSDTDKSFVVSGGKKMGTSFPAAPSYTGYIFKGWFSEEEGKGASFDSSSVVSKDLTVYAYWQKEPTYTVRFIDNIRGTEQSHTVAEGKSLGSLFPADPALSGYRFKGWYTGSDGKGTKYAKNSIISADTDLYACWDKIEYCTVEFIDSLTGIDDTYSIEKSLSMKDLFPSDPSLTGYAFQGWFTEMNGQGNEFTKETAVNSNMKVYGYWKRTHYKVRFVDGLSGTDKSLNVSSGMKMGGYFPASPVFSGYIFQGWYTGQDGNGTVFTGSTSVVSDVTVYAYWIKDTNCKVRFVDNLRGLDKTYIVQEGNTMGQLFPDEPYYDSYIFRGWYTSTDGAGQSFTEDTAVDSDITIYAYWQYGYRAVIQKKSKLKIGELFHFPTSAKKTRFKSSDKSIVKVSKKGVVKARKKSGTATITAEYRFKNSKIWYTMGLTYEIEVE
ncbi:MAG: InlB B-repeat-containing protein [Lachnospiraceae bacterium]|nr:InlB B-repeat-containing protein [Lachnospiraceae bacterium]